MAGRKPAMTLYRSQHDTQHLNSPCARTLYIFLYLDNFPSGAGRAATWPSLHAHLHELWPHL